MKEYPIISDRVSVQQHYESMRRAGECHTMAEMLALRSPPRAQTDREFFEGHCNGNQFATNVEQGNAIRKISQRKGFKPGHNDVYISGLANELGDPLAWVPPTGGRNHIKRVCEMRGWGCDGSVSVGRRECQPEPDIPLAEDIVQRTMKEQIAANPDLARLPKEELREKVIQDHAPK